MKYRRSIVRSIRTVILSINIGVIRCVCGGDRIRRTSQVLVVCSIVVAVVVVVL